MDKQIMKNQKLKKVKFTLWENGNPDENRIFAGREFFFRNWILYIGLLHVWDWFVEETIK